MPRLGKLCNLWLFSFLFFFFSGQLFYYQIYWNNFSLCKWPSKVIIPNDTLPELSELKLLPLCMKSLLSLLLWNHKRKRLETFTNVLSSFRGSFNLIILKDQRPTSSSYCPWKFRTFNKTTFNFFTIRRKDIGHWTTWDWSVFLGQSKWHKGQGHSKVSVLMNFHISFVWGSTEKLFSWM